MGLWSQHIESRITNLGYADDASIFEGTNEDLVDCGGGNERCIFGSDDRKGQAMQQGDTKKTWAMDILIKMQQKLNW